MSSRRPPFIDFTHLLILTVIVSHALRFYTSMKWGDTLETYAPLPGPVYIGFSGAFWTLLGVITLWSINRRKHWARTLFLRVSVLYTGWYWLDRFFLQAGAGDTWPFGLLVTLFLWVMIAAALLNSHHRIDSESEAYERKP